MKLTRAFNEQHGLTFKNVSHLVLGIRGVKTIQKQFRAYRGRKVMYVSERLRNAFVDAYRFRCFLIPKDLYGLILDTANGSEQSSA